VPGGWKMAQMRAEQPSTGFREFKHEILNEIARCLNMPFAPGGEIKHGTLGNEQYSNKADTYGLILKIDRRDIINDDLGAITTVPRKLGRGSGLKINDVFWTTFLNSATFFAPANNNFLSGAASALSIDSLSAAEVAFLDQVDGDGKPIGVLGYRAGGEEGREVTYKSARPRIRPASAAGMPWRWENRPDCE
jgi:hypothetical protein